MYNNDLAVVDNNFRPKTGSIVAANGFIINSVRFAPTAIGFDIVLDVTVPNTIVTDGWVKVADIVNPYNYATDSYRRLPYNDVNGTHTYSDWSIISNTINLYVAPALMNGTRATLLTYVGRAN